MSDWQQSILIQFSRFYFAVLCSFHVAELLCIVVRNYSMYWHMKLQHAGCSLDRLNTGLQTKNKRINNLVGIHPSLIILHLKQRLVSDLDDIYAKGKPMFAWA